MSEFGAVFLPLREKRDLSSEEAEALMHYLIGGESTDEEVLAILNAMCDKGSTQAELVSFARVMRSKADMLHHNILNLVDTCGTGGGRSTFNISTAAAFVAAGAGAKIAKHGNRSSTGLGSADLMESLGVEIGGASSGLVNTLETVGIAFLFAPAHHPAMKHVASARKQLGRRSVFNLLGPLVNPASAPRQLIGVYEPNAIGMVAGALRELNTERAVLAHSRDGLDEISPCAETDVVVLMDGKLEAQVLCPEDFNIQRLEFADIEAGRSLNEAKELFLESISDIQSPRAQAVLPSAAVAIWLADLEPNFSNAADRARTSIVEGHALYKLHQLVEAGGRR